MIGAGVVGLACARALANAGREVIVIEATGAIGTETSSRNSEVIHAGIYYEPGSLKAAACVEGRRRLYRYCAERQIQVNRCGKLIVAAEDAELNTIASLIERARHNGVEAMDLLTPSEVAALEPELRCAGAALSGSTGVVDSHGLMLALQADLEAAGGVIAFHSRVVGGAVTEDGVVLRIEGPDGSSELLASKVITNAGLHAETLLKSIDGFPAHATPSLRYAKGSYFAYSKPAPFRRLVYPTPVQGGLGVHATLDLAGQLRFGPDVEWVDHIDYEVDPARGETFYAAVRRYWPGLPDGTITPAYAGIRPKLFGPQGAVTDFVIQGQAEHGIPGLVNLLGIESPGLTSCLALAEWASGAVLTASTPSLVLSRAAH